MAAANQRGRLPRPDQVSEVCGFRYLGRTTGYLRRGLPPCDRETSARLGKPRLRIAKRFSSSCFSAWIRVDKIPLILSWSDQRSSIDMASKSNFFTDMLRLPWCSAFNVSSDSRFRQIIKRMSIKRESAMIPTKAVESSNKSRKNSSLHTYWGQCRPAQLPVHNWLLVTSIHSPWPENLIIEGKGRRRTRCRRLMPLCYRVHARRSL